MAVVILQLLRCAASRGVCPWRRVCSPSADAPFAVFFADEAAVGVTRMDAPDAATAEAMVMEVHTAAKVHAVDGAQVSEENRVRIVAAWIRED